MTISTFSRFSSKCQITYGEAFTVPYGVFYIEGAPTTSILFCFRDGVAYEEREQWGLSHFVEHILFRGSQNYRSLYELSKAIEAVGGRISAYSTRDLTAFWTKLPLGQEKRGLDVLTELLTKPLMAPEHVKAEQAIIHQERQRELANPSLTASLLLESILLLPDPIARHPVGKSEVISHITPTQMSQYIKEHYTRANMTLVVAGGASHDIADELEIYLAQFDEGTKRRRAEFELPSRVQEDVFLLPTAHAKQVFVSIGWSFPVRGQDKWTLKVLNTLVGAGYSSLFNLRLREEENLTYLCTTKANVYGDKGIFKINFAVDEKNLERSLLAVSETLAEVKDSQCDTELIDAAKVRHCGAVMFAMEDSLAAAKHVGHGLLRSNSQFQLAEYFASIDRVDKNQIAEFAKEKLACDKRNMVLLTGSSVVDELFPTVQKLTRNEDSSIALF